MFPADSTIAGFDPELKAALDAERRRQEDHIELIASENYASPRVLEAQGSVLDEQVRGRLSRASATTAAASTSTSLSSSRSIARRNCSEPRTPTCSRTPARRQTPPRTWR